MAHERRDSTEHRPVAPHQSWAWAWDRKPERKAPRRRQATRIDVLGYVAVPGGPWILVRTYDGTGFIARRVKTKERLKDLARKARVRVLFRHDGFQLEWRTPQNLDPWPYDYLRRRTEIPFWKRSRTNRWHVVRSEDPYGLSKYPKVRP